MIAVPRYATADRPSLPLLARSLLDVDQFDDWLPDPVYFEDQRINDQALQRRVEALLAAPQLAEPQRETLALPRAGGSALSAAVLPLEHRLCAHYVIAAMAPRTGRALLRDKVYGFAFSPKAPPVFSQPGDGLADAFEAAVSAAGRGSGDLSILDIAGFSQNARHDVLAATLARAGARPDETAFLGAVSGTGAQGLPSVDDAYAYVYNYYLQPIDAALAARKANFFRYRDEYWVLDAAARDIVEKGAKSLGFGTRLALQFKGLDGYKDVLSERLPRGSRSDVSEVVGSYRRFGELVATYRCDTWDGSGKDRMCGSDHFELAYSDAAVDPARELGRLAGKGVPDSVELLPLLRRLHTQRRAGVLSRPPFAAVSADFTAFRKALLPARRALVALVEAGVRDRSEWLLSWTLPVLSDLSPLAEREVALLLQVVQNAAHGPVAVHAARLALARGSSLPAQRFWKAGAPGGAWRLRSSLMAARYLAARGEPGPWKALQDAGRRQEGELWNYLSANLPAA